MRKQEKVLIIEDEPSIAENIAFGLGQEGFDSEWRSTGFEAIDALKKERFSAVILDVGLPDTTGFEVCKEIRSFSQVPILFLTARNEEIDRILGLEIGGDDYVCKPFSVRELVTRVRVILRRSSGNPVSVANHGQPSRRTFGPFEVDEERYQISLHGKLLVLTRYEFRMLRLLLKRPGRVYTREELMYQVWEEPEASGERTVDAHVRSLRAKLREVDSDGDYIKTHRGIGYSMEY